MWMRQLKIMMGKKTERINGIELWVKVSVIIQGIIAIFICMFASLQYQLNKRIEEQSVLERSYKIKQEAANILFNEDPNKLLEAKLRNILEWIEEKQK
jgi:hypothetical protein